MSNEHGHRAGGVPPGTAWVTRSEQVEWESDADAMMSRRQRLAARGPYRAAVPPFIADLRVDVSPDVSAESTEASIAIARFDAEVSPRLGAIGDGDVAPLPTVLLRAESASSSQIEQITAGARALALATLGERTGPNAALVAANAAAMQAAMALSDRISVASILDVHTALLATSTPESAGRFRQEAVWIGGRGSTPHTASFVPPRHDRVPDLMDDLVTFSERTDVPPFTQAAVAHAQFETIHPFPDGNGRVGRTLVHALLRNSGVTRRATVPVSSGLLASVGDYYDALGAYREGDLNPIVSRFADAAFRAVENGRILVDDLVRTHAAWRERVTARRDAAVWRALPIVIAQPAVSVAYIADITGVSSPAAQRAIDQMVDAGVLTLLGARKRSRVWTSNEVVTALDAFAARAGCAIGSGSSSARRCQCWPSTRPTHSLGRLTTKPRST